MKKSTLLTSAFLMIGLLFGMQVMAQHIDLGRAQSAQECANVTKDGFTATFSFSGIEATEISTEKGVFSDLTMDGTSPAANVGEPAGSSVSRHHPFSEVCLQKGARACLRSTIWSSTALTAYAE